jgi:hypothetical protein
MEKKHIYSRSLTAKLASRNALAIGFNRKGADTNGMRNF